MKATNLFTIATAAALGSGSLTAQTAPGGSQHFEAVKAHLDLGGEAFTYVELDGDPQRVGKFIDDALALAADASGGQMPEIKASAVDLFRILGLGNIAAVGSSAKSGDGRTVSRSYLHLNGAREGVLKFSGGVPAPYAAAALAPASADLVIESEFDLSGLGAVVRTVLAELGNPEWRAMWGEFQAQPAGPLGLNVGEIVGMLDSRFVAIGRLHETERLKLPDAPVDIPNFELFIQLENMAWLVEKLAPELPPQAVQKGDGFLRMALGPMPPDAPIIDPVLHFDTGTGTLSAASGAAFLTECLAGSGGLFGEAEFKKVSAALPEQGNSFSFFSEQFGKEVSKLYAAAIAGDGEVPQAAAEYVIKLMQGSIPALAGSYASASANLPNGILTVSNAREGFGQGMSTTAITLVAIGASVSVPVFSSVQKKAVQNRDLQNLRQCALALRVYAGDNEGEYPAQVDAPELIDEVGTDEIFRYTDPASGEVKRPLYVSGLNDSSPARFVLLACPWIQGGQRAAVFCDGSAQILPEGEFQARLAETLQASGGKLVE